MGTWETGLYSCDLACDVRDDYREMLVFKYPHEEAVKRLVQEHHLSEDDPYDAAGWFALAESAWKYGHLDEDLKQLVQRLYDEEAERELWVDSPNGWKKRKAVIAKLMEKILVPREKPAKPTMLMPAQTDWQEGDLLAFQLQDGPHKDHYIVILIVSRTDRPLSRYADSSNFGFWTALGYVLTTYDQTRFPSMSDFAERIEIFYDTDEARLERNRRDMEIYHMKRLPKLGKRPGDGDYQAKLYTNPYELSKKLQKQFSLIGRIDADTLNMINRDIMQADFGQFTPLIWGAQIVAHLCKQNHVLTYYREGRK